MSQGQVQVSIRGVDYELGEHETSYRDVFRFEEKRVEFNMPDDAASWGWGRLFRSERSRAELAVASARRALAKAEFASHDIDAVVLAAAEFPAKVAEHATYCRTVLGSLELGHAVVIGVTLARCNTTLSAIHLAHSLVAARVYRTVLVVASDRIEDEEDRFQSFAMFSDAAASCVVSSRPGGDLAVRATVSALDVSEMDSAGRVDVRLGRSVLDELTSRSGVSANDIAVVIPPNLFTPIVRMNERQSAFRNSQLYLGNIPERGHCFSADPLVNLVDHRAANGWRERDHILLTSSVPGSRLSVLTEVLDADTGPHKGRSHHG